MLPRCFVISLKGSPRRQVIGPALHALGIPFEFFDAVNGRLLSPADIAASYDGGHRTNRQLSAPEIGCALSHMTLYRRIVAESIPAAIILEDDAIVGPRLRRFAERADDLPGDVDVVNFFAADGVVYRKSSFDVAGIACHRTSSSVSHAVGYYIRRHGADLFSQANSKITKHADWPVGFHRLAFFVTLPFVVDHDRGAPSTLAEDRRFAVIEARPGASNLPPLQTVSERVKKKARRLHRSLFPGQFIDLNGIPQNTQAEAESGASVEPEFAPRAPQPPR
jgi:glycosyl transferase family 25